MGIFDRIWRSRKGPEADPRPKTAMHGEQKAFASLTSADLYDFMIGGETASGSYVNTSNALNNMALLRCVSLIAESIGMLPLNLIARGDEKAYATEHPIYNILKNKPNDYQSSYKFKSTMQTNVLLHGNAYARIIRSSGRVIKLIPLNSERVKPVLDETNFTMRYEVTRDDNTPYNLGAKDILHLADLSEDGVVGISRVKKAKEAIGLALQAEKAAARLFKNGVMAGGALVFPGRLKPEQIANIQTSLEARYAGADQAHKWMVLEEGIKPEKWSETSADSQHLENRNHQIQEIARAFGVPRPLLMMDDTSWGSGIEQLGIFFVQYGLQHWFTVWEQALENALLDETERRNYYIKFNERALLRGTLKDQAEFFTKSLGSGGHMPWMTANEVRDLQDLSKFSDPLADKLESPIMRNTNDTSQTS